MELTLILSAANRPAVDLVKTRTAPLDAAYTGDACGSAHDTGYRRYVDYRAASGAPHRGDHVLGAQEHTLGVDVHHQIPVLGRHVQIAVPYCNARVVDQDVQAPVLALSEVHGALPVFFAGHVQVDIFDLAAELRDFGLDLPALVIEHVAEHDHGPLAREQFDLDRALAFWRLR